MLVVEDEAMIAMMLESMLDDLGHEVAAVAGRLDMALTIAREADIDLAILDVNLRGEPSFPVADVLAARGVPFLFATGYGADGLTAPFQNTPTLRKPFELKDLSKVIERMKP